MDFIPTLFLALLLALVSCQAFAADFDYRGQVFIKKTGLDNGELVELETRLIFTSMLSFTEVVSNMLSEDSTFAGKGKNIMDSFFNVSGELDLVRIIVKEKDGPNFDIVCDKGYSVAQLNIPGTKTFTCTNFLGPGSANKWIVKLTVIVSFKRKATFGGPENLLSTSA